MRSRIACVGCVGAIAIAGTASAASVGRTGTAALLYRGGDGEANIASLKQDPKDASLLHVTDHGPGVSISFGSPCTRDADAPPNTADCSVAGLSAIYVILGDGDDQGSYNGRLHTRMNGGGGRDHFDGGKGPDFIRGGPGGDSLQGHDGMDVLLGEGGADILAGYAGDDRVEGSGGNDTLFGTQGQDALKGGRGNDSIDASGDGERDQVNCGKGRRDQATVGREDRVDGCEQTRRI